MEIIAIAEKKGYKKGRKFSVYGEDFQPHIDIFSAPIGDN